MPPTLDLHAKLEGLAEGRRQAQGGLEEIAAELELAEKQQGGGDPKRLERLKAALPRARQTVADIDLAMVQTRQAIDAERDAARKRPMSKPERETFNAALAYLAAIDALDAAAGAFAKAIRTAQALGLELAEISGNAQLKRITTLGAFRQRVTAGVVRTFERDPDAAGAWGAAGALIELGDARRMTEIAKLGIGAYERRGLRNLLTPNIGAAL